MIAKKIYKSGRYQKGLSLVVGMIFLVITTILVLLAFEVNQNNFVIQNNFNHYDQAFQAAESARYMLTNEDIKLIENYILNSFQDNVADYIDIHPSITLMNPLIRFGTGRHEDPTAPMETDIQFTMGNLESTIGIFQGDSRIGTGNNISQHNGYDGTGKSLAVGTELFFELQFNGIDSRSRSNAEISITYKHVAKPRS